MLRVFATLMLGLVLVGSMATAEAPAGYSLAFSDDFEKGSERWTFTDPKAWTMGGEAGAKFLSLTASSDYTPQVRSPKSIARVKELSAEDFIMDVRIQQTGREYGHRDACIFFGYTGPSQFYYVHLATQADDHANSIFLVNNAARVSIAKERTDGTDWAKGYHQIRIKREASSGRIEVFFNDMSKPVMVAEDKTFTSGGFGLGSFDDTADFDDVAIYVKNK